MTVSTTPKTTDTKLMLWKRILQHYQNQAGALAHNDLRSSDGVRGTLVKILRALQTI